MNRRPGIAINMDFGEINAGLSAVLGMAEGLTKQTQLSKSVLVMTEKSIGDFGRIADGRGDDELAHVYRHGVEPSPTSRLWRLTWNKNQRGGDAIISFIPDHTIIYDEDLMDDAAAHGRKMAGHRFIGGLRSEHFEYTETLISVPGVQNFTIRVGGDVAVPKTLVKRGLDGRVFFPVKWERNNPHYMKFTDLFNQYWHTEFEQRAVPKVEQAFSSTVAFGTKEVNKAVKLARSAGMVARPPKGISGIFMTDMGKPSRGITVSPTRGKAVSKRVQNRFGKEIENQWRR
jgi:hypothetical protein